MTVISHKLSAWWTAPHWSGSQVLLRFTGTNVLEEKTAGLTASGPLLFSDDSCSGFLVAAVFLLHFYDLNETPHLLQVEENFPSGSRWTEASCFCRSVKRFPLDRSESSNPPWLFIKSCSSLIHNLCWLTAKKKKKKFRKLLKLIWCDKT